MPNAEYGKLEYESGRTAYGMTLLTDQGDHKDYNSAVNMWSQRSGYVPDVKPAGLATGGVITTAASGTNNLVDVTKCTHYIAGTLGTTAAKTDLAITRSDGTPGAYKITSVTLNSGGTVVAVAGTDGTAFTETRDAAGGPPLVAVDSIEVGQVRFDGTVAAVVAADEVKQIPNVHTEWFNFPTWNIDYLSETNNVLGNAGVTFTSALMVNHTGSVTKRVYSSFNTPSFAEVPDAYDFAPPSNSHSISSTQVYNRTVGAVAASLGNGSFSALLQDGITDGFLREIDQYLWFRFYQNRNNAPYVLCQGKLGITRSFPAGDNIVASCTIGAEEVARNING